MKNNKLSIGIGVAVFFVFAIVLFASRGGVGKNANDISKVTINKNGNEITIHKNGRVDYSSGSGNYTDYWGQDKISAFFGYFDKNYLVGESDLLHAGEDAVTIDVNGETKTYVLGSDEEIADAAAEDAQTPDGDSGSGGGGGGEDIDNYFTSSPSPTSTPAPGGTSSSTSTPTPTPPNGGDPECLYWRLSYCVRKRTPAPTPTPAGTAEIRPDDCESNTQTGKTVISNELCIPTPTP